MRTRRIVKQIAWDPFGHPKSSDPGVFRGSSVVSLAENLVSHPAAEIPMKFSS